MKRYKFEVIVEEGNLEFWEELGENSGCDEVTSFIKDLLYESGFEPIVTLKEYTNE